jgi:hypothetical protein
MRCSVSRSSFVDTGRGFSLAMDNFSQLPYTCCIHKLSKELDICTPDRFSRPDLDFNTEVSGQAMWLQWQSPQKFNVINRTSYNIQLRHVSKLPTRPSFSYDTKLALLCHSVGRLEAKYLFHVRLPLLLCHMGRCGHHTATLVL